MSEESTITTIVETQQKLLPSVDVSTQTEELHDATFEVPTNDRWN